MKDVTEQPAGQSRRARVYHNVIIFGAGASYDAGIPLLPAFVDTMWEYAIKGKVGGKPIPEEHVALLTAANGIRRDLERYNSRAYFDNYNLEDILSLLSFEALGDKQKAENYNTMVSAVARTIELSCNLPYIEDAPASPPPLGTPYHRFWLSLLRKPLSDNLPALITFNYDLVLERALWQCFHRRERGTPKPTVNSCSLKYAFRDDHFSIKTTRHVYSIRRGPQLSSEEHGEKAVYIPNENTDADIPYYKLHGSLNWSRASHISKPIICGTKAVDEPLILPPCI